MSRYYCVMCERPTRYYKFRDDDGNLLHYCRSCKGDVEEFREGVRTERWSSNPNDWGVDK